MGRNAFLPILLVLGACQAEPAMFGKSPSDRSRPSAGDTDEGGSPDEEAPEPAKKKPPKPDPPLVFTYDGQTLRARILTTLADGAALSFSVSGARNGEDRSNVDCSTLKNVDLTGAEPSGKDVVVDVPADESFLASRKSGSVRTIIQGCLVDRQGQVVSKVSTSLMNAWDADPTSMSQSPRKFHGVEAYANACIDELGEIPMWEDGKSFDCTDPSMAVIPITATDTNGNVVSVTGDTPFPLGTAERNATSRCDRPAWLESDERCAPFTRIGRYTNSEGSRFVIICRRSRIAAPSDSKFGIVGVIGHNPTSGKTCWFNNHLDDSSTDGAGIPPPNTPTADRWWMNSWEIGGQGCPKCHDSDPFIHTPWVDQARHADGHTMVPRIGEDPAYTMTTKYSNLAAESFMVDSESRRDWAHPRHLTNVGACGSCHRIGSKSTLDLYSFRSVGDSSDSTFQSSWMTSAFRTFEKLHWMPTSPVTQSEWTASWAPSMQTISNCSFNGGCREDEVPH
jgi:hypothetical protein